MIKKNIQKNPKNKSTQKARSTRTHKAFVQTVLAYYTEHGRHALPWRATQDPYVIMVSEIMLQQTQVDRVVGFFERFMRRFPTPVLLADAKLSDVLMLWQGLGYNRRAKMLHEAAREIVARGGVFPRTREDVLKLSGVGPYTAGAIRAFAYDEPDVMIETNIRTVYIHHFFSHTSKVHDRELLMLIEDTLKYVKSPREWYSALMDYGTYIKKMHPNPSRRSVHHTKQSTFKGSLREARGLIVRSLVAKQSLNSLPKTARFNEALRSLERDGMVVRRGNSWRIGGTKRTA